MKNFSLLGCLLLSCTLAFGKPVTPVNSNYVVIGAFALEENAIHFVEAVRKESLNAKFEINPNRQLFYVYVLQTLNHKQAIEEALKLRSNTRYMDTWVFFGVLGQNISSSNESDIQPETGHKIETVAVEDKPAVVEATPATPTPSAAEVKEIIAEPETAKPAEVTYPKTDEAEGNGKHFVFKIYKTTNQSPVDGEVNIVDPEKNKKVNTFKGNQDVIVRPITRSGDFSAECEVFGYRKIKQIININTPEATEGILVEDGQAIVPFELVRLRKGDYAVMYNVFFFKDAAIMRPESSYEVNSLAEMMKENPKYRIRIHGHTNGNAAGKLILPNDPKNFFSLSNTSEAFGSAKKLSEERSILIQNYLIAQGIDASRLEVKAWGGKKSLYEKNHPQAHSNVRVEIEIIEE